MWIKIEPPDTKIRFLNLSTANIENRIRLTSVNDPEHAVSYVAVGNKKDCLNQAHAEQLKWVHLAYYNTKRDQDCGCSETSFQDTDK